MPTLADYPELVAQLDRKKNGAFAPESIAFASNQKLWWRCPEGPDHLWEAPVHTRTAGHGCPFCANLRLSHTNTLAVVAPEVARQWHPTKNGKLTPRDVVPGTPRVVWWKCPEAPDHVWRRAIVSRVREGRGCPFCAGQQPSAAYNLAVSAPHLIAEWHPTKNGKLRPRDVTVGSGKVVWWKCPEGPEHEWQCAVGDRQRLGCPFCSNKRVSSTNSLAAVAPEIAAEWHPTKNGKLTPRDVVAGTDRRIWWRCPKGPDHEWQANIANRTDRHGLPVLREPAPLRIELARRRVPQDRPRVAPDQERQAHPPRRGRRDGPAHLVALRIRARVERRRSTAGRGSAPTAPSAGASGAGSPSSPRASGASRYSSPRTRVPTTGRAGG